MIDFNNSVTVFGQTRNPYVDLLPLPPPWVDNSR